MYCIVIPIYKTELSEYETIATKQCCKVLGHYPIIFVTHKKLDCTVYNNICTEYGIKAKYEYFNKKYFNDISCYSALLLSKEFYIRFNNYEYMLIYQTDAYVFKDELEYWCKKGYDYIGSPFVRLSDTKPIREFVDLLLVGNGGFSLRNIKTFIKSCSIIRIHMLHRLNLVQSCYESILKKLHKNYIYFIPKIFLYIYLKVVKFIFCRKNKTTLNEDVIWSWYFDKKGNIPALTEAAKFAFENSPENLYKINNYELPFGCHGWYKDTNMTFYGKHICIA